MRTHLVLLVVCLSFASPPPKELNGPPSEFPLHAIPQTWLSSLRGSSWTQSVEPPRLNSSSGNVSSLEWTTAVPIDSPNFSFCLVTPLSREKISLVFHSPQGSEVPLKPHFSESSFPLSDTNGVKLPAFCYQFSAFPVGLYHLAAFFKDPLPSASQALLVVKNEGDIMLHSYLQDYSSLKVGSDISFTARIFNGSIPVFSSELPLALQDVVDTASMDLVTPHGMFIKVPMYDDGLHGDWLPADGVYGASVQVAAEGLYSVQVRMGGATPDGTLFHRTSTQLVAVVANDLQLTGTANGTMVPVDSEEGVSHRLVIHLGLTHPRNGNATRFRPYVQLWGTDTHTGDMVAVCWASGLVEVSSTGASPSLALSVDPRWIALANVSGPFVLRDVYITDIDVHIPFATAVEIPVTFQDSHSSVLSEELLRHTLPLAVTAEMRNGPIPASLRNAAPLAGVPTLVATHGYCATQNPWEVDAASFTDTAFFEQLHASVPNDKFAQNIANFAQGFPVFSMVAHSQGGLASTHLLNYYHSGLSRVTGGPKVQSVGSPYQGNTGAGTAADLIRLFGYGCGENIDLTTTGAQLWLTGITSETRASVEYYSTQYVEAGLLRYCAISQNLLLQWPNDGIAELVYTTLEGATFMGNTPGECHSPDMAYAPQTSDKTRNAILNARAARKAPLNPPF